MKIGQRFILICLCMLLANCTRMIANVHKVPYDEQTRQYAREMLESALQKIPAVETFKGIGNIKIIQDNQTESGRIAWMVSGSDKIRIEFLTPYGQPWASFSSDGKYLYIFVHKDQQFYKKGLSQSDLKKMIFISVRPEEVISLLAGRPHLIEYSFISMTESESSSGPVIVLQKEWWGPYQKIYLDEHADFIRSVEVFDGSGKLRYVADFYHRIQDGEIVPHRLEMANGQGTKVNLLISRHWKDVDISPSAFVLKPPGG